MKKREDLKILLVQVRNDKETIDEELGEFLRYGKLNAGQIDALNVLSTPSFSPTIMERYDTLFVGGSSDTSVINPSGNPFDESFRELTLHCLNYEIPVFASCYGFQASIVALGGKLIEDKPKMEFGTYNIFLTDDAKDDPLFKDTPNPLKAICGHKEFVTEMPSGFTNLAFTPSCEFHAFRVNGKPFYGFQFHPELDDHDLVARITRYKERYLDSSDELNEIIKKSTPTPDANALVEKFIDRIALPNT